MKAREEKAQFEKMLDVAGKSLESNTPDEIPEELQNEPSFDIDFDKLQRECDKQAKKMLKNATGLMIGDEFTKNSNYLKEKIKTDVISLAGMLYQMELKKRMQQDLATEVAHGAKHPRMYEVFGSLGKVISEDNKQLLQTVEAIKETYLTLRENIVTRNEDQKQLQAGISKTPDGGLLTSGSRDLIESVKFLRKMEQKEEDDNITDINPEKID